MIFKKFVIYLLVIAFAYPSSQTTEQSEEESDHFDVPELILDSLQLTLSSKLLLDIYSPKGQVLKGYLGWLPKRSNSSYKSCSGNDSPAESICLNYENEMKLLVTHNNLDQCEEDTMTCHSVQCFHIHWQNHRDFAMDCFVLGDELWYGGTGTISHSWPLNGISKSWHPATTGDPLHHSNGPVLENIWISTGGFAIYVEHQTPLFVNFNETTNGKLCLSTSSKFPYHNTKLQKRELTYSICAAMTVKEAYAYTAHRWLKKPKGVPDEHVFMSPIWSTWARYKRDIDESKVLEFALKIKNSDLHGSQIEIDDKWENCYGDLEFNMTKFPNPKQMTTKLEELGFPTTLWVHPFCNPECKTYALGKERGFWVKDKQGNPIEVNWWNGEGSAVLDTTNPKAVEWFTERLQRLRKLYGIESFKFDAGELEWMKTYTDFVLNDENANIQPNVYAREYAKLAAQFGGRVEARVGYETQDLPIFIRMFDKFSHWDYTNGLQTLIPTALQLSILGYPFIIPDMIGGNNYTPNNGSIPNQELYIRWLEANLFMPVLQFSIAPFDYGDKVMQMTKKMLELRDKHIDYIIKLAHQAIDTGDPIIRPLWWIAPDDMEATPIDSQFLVGDSIMVAPILEKGAKKRNIYLPEGKWADVQRGKTYEGSQWLYDYEAPLNFLPYFIRQS